MNQTRAIRGRQWAHRHMRAVRVDVLTPDVSADADPVTLKATTTGDTRAGCRAAIIETSTADVDGEALAFGSRDMSMMVLDEAIAAGDRIRFAVVRFDTTLVDKWATVRTVSRDPNNPMRRVDIRLDNDT